MNGLVVDASAGLKLLREEAGQAEVRQHLHEQTLAGQPILVPSLFWLEIVNVLAVRYRYPPDAIVEAVYELEQIGLATAEVGRPGVLAVIDAVGRFGLTAYDAAYLVLAQATGAKLLTADARLGSAAGDRAILVETEGGVAEVSAAYGVQASWTDWPGAATYLTELRSSL